MLNDRGNVNPEIRDRVLEIVKQVNYQPNHLARALINSRKHVRIGVVINSIGNPFFSDVLKGIHHRERKLKGYGLELIIKEIKAYSAEEQINAVEELLSESIECCDALENGDPSPATYARYENLFKGKAGIVVLEAITPQYDYISRIHQLSIKEHNLPALKKFVCPPERDQSRNHSYVPDHSLRRNQQRRFFQAYSCDGRAAAGI